MAETRKIPGMRNLLLFRRFFGFVILYFIRRIKATGNSKNKPKPIRNWKKNLIKDEKEMILLTVGGLNSEDLRKAIERGSTVRKAKAAPITKSIKAVIKDKTKPNFCFFAKAGARKNEIWLKKTGRDKNTPQSRPTSMRIRKPSVMDVT